MRNIKQSKKSIYVVLIIFLMLVLMPLGKSYAASSVIIQTKLAADSATVNWSKVSGATEYYLGIGESKDEADKDATAHTLVFGTDTINYTFTGLKPGMNYYVTLRYKYTDEEGEKEENAATAIVKTIPDKIRGLTQARWYIYQKMVYVTWEAQTAGHYEYVLMNKTGKKIKSGDLYTNSFDRSIENKKCYSFKVRAIARINGKTYEGAWSDRIYLFAQPMIKSYNYGNDFDLKISGGRLILKWDKVKYANAGYRIFVSKKRDKDYVKVASVGKRKSVATIKRFKGKSFKNSGTYYIFVQGIRKSGGRIGTTGIGYVWEYKKGRVRRTYYHGKY